MFHRVHTWFWIMFGLCVLRSLTVWNKSTTPSERMRSSTIHNAQNTPVLPTPSLRRKSRGIWESYVPLKTQEYSSVPTRFSCADNGLMNTIFTDIWHLFWYRYQPCDVITKDWASGSPTLQCTLYRTVSQQLAHTVSKYRYLQWISDIDGIEYDIDIGINWLHQSLVPSLKR